MRILFLDHPQFTSATFFLWHGLNEILAPGSVVLHPNIPTHFDADAVNFDDLPWFRDMTGQVARKELPWGVPPFAPGEELAGGGQKVVKRYEAARRFKPPDRIPEETEIASMLNSGDFSLVILGNSHRVPTIALGRLRERVKAMPPIVYYDAGERDELNEHWVHVFRPRLTFKQILTPEVGKRGLTTKIPSYDFKILPLPLSSPLVGTNEHFPVGIPIHWFRDNDDPLDKLFDIFYSMGPTWDGRATVIRMLDALTKETGAATVGTVTYKNYHVVVSRSRMAVTMRGSGRDTQRYWEIPLYKTLMLADGTMGAIHPYPFEDGKTAVFYRSLEDLREKVVRYLPRQGRMEEERHAIARAGKEHLWKYHSTGARAVFFLERIKEHLGIIDSDADSAINRWKNDHKLDERAWPGPVEGGNF